MEKNDQVKIMEELSKAFPLEAIQVASKEQTHRGYDMIGIGYQYLVDRFNEVLDTRWGYDYLIIKEIETEVGAQKKRAYEIIVECSIWIIEKENIRKCIGGHRLESYTDCLKSAITNAFKKAAAFWGVGREAYLGTLDDDYVNQIAKEKDDVSDAHKKDNQNRDNQTQGKVKDSDNKEENSELKIEGGLSEKQVKLIYYRLKEAGINEEDFKKFYQLKHIKDLHWTKMTEALSRIEENKINVELVEEVEEVEEEIPF